MMEIPRDTVVSALGIDGDSGNGSSKEPWTTRLFMKTGTYIYAGGISHGEPGSSIPPPLHVLQIQQTQSHSTQSPRYIAATVLAGYTVLGIHTDNVPDLMEAVVVRPGDHM